MLKKFGNMRHYDDSIALFYRILLGNDILKPDIKYALFRDHVISGLPQSRLNGAAIDSASINLYFPAEWFNPPERIILHTACPPDVLSLMQSLYGTRLAIEAQQQLVRYDTHQRRGTIHQYMITSGNLIYNVANSILRQLPLEFYVFAIGAFIAVSLNFIMNLGIL